jgi:hypothetical protein
LPFGVLLSALNSFGEVDGVWVCTFNEVPGVSMILRDSLIRVKRVQAANENKGGEMELLYRYLTSHEFVQIIGVINENYSSSLHLGHQLSIQRFLLDAYLGVTWTQNKDMGIFYEDLALFPQPTGLRISGGLRFGFNAWGDR